MHLPANPLNLQDQSLLKSHIRFSRIFVVSAWTGIFALVVIFIYAIILWWNVGRDNQELIHKLKQSQQELSNSAFQAKIAKSLKTYQGNKALLENLHRLLKQFSKKEIVVQSFSCQKQSCQLSGITDETNLQILVESLKEHFPKSSLESFARFDSHQKKSPESSSTSVLFPLAFTASISYKIP